MNKPKEETENFHFTLQFGAMARSIAKQLQDQKVPVDFEKNKKEIENLQDIADAITLLHLHGLITDTAAHSLRKKLIKLTGARISTGREARS